MIIPDYSICPLEIIILLGNGIIDSISFLFSCAPFFCVSKNVSERKAIGNSIPLCSWDSCASQASSCIGIDYVDLVRVRESQYRCLNDGFLEFQEGFMMGWCPVKFHLLVCQ